MSPDRDDRNDDLEPETYEEEPPRSIFAATWFRAVLVLIVLGVIGAVAVPYILDAVNPPPTQQAVVKSAPLPATPSTPPPPPSRALAPTVTSTPAESPSLPPAQRSTPPTAAMPETPKSASATPTARPSLPLAKADAPDAKPAAPPAKTEPAMPPAKSEPSKTEPVTPTTNGAPKSSTSKSSAGTGNSTAKKPAADTPTRTGTKPVAKKSSESRQAATSTATGVYWVQVGAFKDEETAKRLAARLREQNFKVADVAASAPAPAASAATPTPSATPAPAGGDQYDVFVTGLPAAELNARLTAKGLASETSGTGVVIKPSLPLRDAVALSKDLAVDGLKVQVRRAGGTGGAARPSSASAAAKAPVAADGLYRVRVGSFNDRAAAVAAQRELEAKGYKPFIARGER